MLLLGGYMKKFVPKYIIIHLILFYRSFISPLFPPRCRFYPSCSFFAMGTIEKYGVFYGSWLAIKRLFRCHPFSRHAGYDPLP